MTGDVARDAVAAVGWESEGYAVVIIGSDGAQVVRTSLDFKTARRMVALTIARQLEEVEARERVVSPRRRRGGGWVIAIRCPDAVTRIFRSRRDGSPRPERRRPLTSSVTRFDVLQRDGFRCRYCGTTAGHTELHVDHVIPLARGGTDDPGNLVTACVPCNLGKSDRELNSRVDSHPKSV